MNAAFPAPDSPEGQAWAAAGFPVKDGAPVIPAAAPAEPMEPPAVGSIARYTFHDAYANPPGDRTQVVLVTGHDTDAAGNVTAVRGFALGFEDVAAAFGPGMLD